MTPQAIELIARITAFLTAIPIHEAAHGYASYKLGDPTAKIMGRITLNPIKHIDFMGLIAMLLIGIGWAKPVPVDPCYYKNRKLGMAVSAAAGPLSNLLMAYIWFVLFKLVGYIFPMFTPVTPTVASIVSGVYLVLYYLAIININLAIFNLLPIPPFDGSKIFGAVLPDRFYFGMQKYERYVMGGILLLMFVLPRFTPYDPLGFYLDNVGGFVKMLIDKGTGYIDLIFNLIRRA